jgi:hypothetical protein
MSIERDLSQGGDISSGERTDVHTGDGRQSAAAAAIARGVRRLLAGHGWMSLTEVGLANGRRADVIALDDKGGIAIVEVKSSPEDFRSDSKWPEYRDYCDRFYFAVAPDFPVALLPEDTGLILADRFGGDIVRPAPAHALAPARRKALVLRLARLAMGRVHRGDDPDFAIEALTRG